jgi:hypothetical protein
MGSVVFGIGADGVLIVMVTKADAYAYLARIIVS